MAVTVEEEAAALVADLAVRAGMAAPPIEVLDRPGQRCGLAGTRRRRGVGPVVQLRADLASLLSPAALRYVMAHELGHVAQYRRRRVWLVDTVLRSAPAVLGLVVLSTGSAVAARSIGAASWNPAGLLVYLLAGLAMTVACFGAYAWRRRAGEYAADAFAVRLCGTDAGAAEALALGDAVGGRSSAVLDLHPPTPARLMRMRAAHGQ